jgi:hypothetical protein
MNHPHVPPTTIVEGRQADPHQPMHGINLGKVHPLDGSKAAQRTFDGGGPRHRVPEEPPQVPGKAPGPAKVSRGLPSARESHEFRQHWTID